MAEAEACLDCNIQKQDNAEMCIKFLKRDVESFDQSTRDFIARKEGRCSMEGIVSLMTRIARYASALKSHFEDLPEAVNTINDEMTLHYACANIINASSQRFNRVMNALQPADTFINKLMDDAKKLRDGPINMETEAETLTTLREELRSFMNDHIELKKECARDYATVEIMPQIEVQFRKVLTVESIISEYFLRKYIFA